jgi:protein involved in polysaccharide export with SLBB domain
MKLKFSVFTFSFVLLAFFSGICYAKDFPENVDGKSRNIMGRYVATGGETIISGSNKTEQTDALPERGSSEYVKKRLQQLEKALEEKTREEIVAENNKKLRQEKESDEFYIERIEEDSDASTKRLSKAEIELEVAERLEKSQVSLKIFGSDFFSRGEIFQGGLMAGSAPSHYKLGPGDELKMIVWSELGDETVYDVQVNPEGQIYVPVIGVMGVSGLTVGEFEQMALGQMAKKFEHFKGQVTLTKIRTIQIYVVGEVEKPGALTISGLSTAFTALYQAGGPTQRGSMRKIKVLGSAGKSTSLDLYRYFLSGDRSQDVSLDNGDTIFVPAIETSVKVKGLVTRPAIYEIKEGDSLAEVLAMAGNALPKAYSARVKVLRWTGNQRRRAYDLSLGSLSELKAFTVVNGDEIIVEQAIETVGNTVEIEGAVKKPGEYSVNNGFRVADLIKKAGGLKEEEANRNFGQIIRKGQAGIEEVVTFNLRYALMGNKDENIVLKPFDRVMIFSQNEIQADIRYINLDGAVRRPGEYIYRNGMRLADLLLKARGLSIDAAGECEIARSRGDRSEIIKVNCALAIKNPKSEDNVVLKPLDRISILSVGDRIVEPEVVFIKGQVKRPGPYSLKYRGETLSSLVKRAGGLTVNAFPEGAVFLRKMENIASEKQLNTAKVVQEEMFRQASLDLRADLLRSGAKLDSLSEVKAEVQAGTVISDQVYEQSLSSDTDMPTSSSAERQQSGYSQLDIRSRSFEQASVRIPVPLKEIVEGHAEEFEDISLLSGDQITIPVIPTTVSVLGAVMNPTTILFSRNRNAGFYINRAGGFSPSSNHRRTVVVRAGGEVLPMRHVKRIERGDIILVPPKARLVRPDKLKEWGNIANILGNLAVTYKVVSDNN